MLFYQQLGEGKNVSAALSLLTASANKVYFSLSKHMYLLSTGVINIYRV